MDRRMAVPALPMSSTLAGARKSVQAAAVHRQRRLGVAIDAHAHGAEGLERRQAVGAGEEAA